MTAAARKEEDTLVDPPAPSPDSSRVRYHRPTHLPSRAPSQGLSHVPPHVCASPAVHSSTSNPY